MADWNASLDPAHPCWDGYRGLLDALPAGPLPEAAWLNERLPGGARTRSGRPVRFVAAERLPGVAYERHIHATGEVSTRRNVHDLFNAFVWCRLPHFKAALNALHFEHLEEQSGGRRGRQRDALTLLDESGVIVTGPAPGLFAALTARDWQQAFVERRSDWRRVRVVVCGHAILEKCLRPYKALTAHALYLPAAVPPDDAVLDRELAALLLEARRLRSLRDLAPLPLAGIPGWWTDGPQDAAFYADRSVFRPPRAV